ncbi:MAG: hypothetical protein ACD_11C00004G0013 [uncultured bacterium]|nr:MAG: hypothetical protein ACD_11C00004G0013 [uncultured bacterium]HBR71647.1 hypothetical protein [Candidatus Moranbacteria bacterium]
MNLSGYADVFDVTVILLTNFYNSPFMSFVKFFLVIYSLVLIFDVILILMVKGLGGDIRKGLTGMDIPVVSKGKMQKKWDKVVSRMKTGSISQFKVAILEADMIVDDILGKIGYKGNNMTERLAQVNPNQLDYLEELQKAHEVRNKIVHEESFVLDETVAKETLETYEKFLRYLEFM